MDNTNPAAASPELDGIQIRLEQAGAAREAAAILRNAGFSSVADLALRLASEKELPLEQYHERRFFRDTYLVTVVRDEPHPVDELAAIAEAITTGGFTGQHTLIASEALDVQQLREACLAVGSDPEFFGDADEDQEDSAAAERGG